MGMGMYPKHSVEWKKKVAEQYVKRIICINYLNTWNNTSFGQFTGT